MGNKLTLKERFSGLLFDRNTGKVVGSKLFAVIGHTSMAVLFIYQNIVTGFNTEQWLIYASLVAGHKTAEKFIGLKWGTTKPAKEE